MTLGEEARSSPLNTPRLENALVQPGGLWQQISVVAETGSTNADLLRLAGSGAAEGTVLAAEAQNSGRGRLGRSWSSTPGADLTFSVLLRPAGVPVALLGWLPLLSGVAVAAALREHADVEAGLKWPNDVLAGGRKLAGILAESQGGAVVVGVGLNVFQQAAQLPVPTATSVLLERGSHRRGSQESAPVPGGGLREQLLAAILGRLEHWYRAWAGSAGGDPDRCGLRQEYLRLCATVGREVRVTLPGGEVLAGQATTVDRVGRLVVRSGGGVTEVSAGDVVHVR